MKKVQGKTEVELMATHSSSSEAFEACRLFVLLTGEWTLIKPLISLFLKLITSRQLMLKEALRSFWGIFSQLRSAFSLRTAAFGAPPDLLSQPGRRQGGGGHKKKISLTEQINCPADPNASSSLGKKGSEKPPQTIPLGLF